MDGVDSVGAWVRGWRESIFGTGREGRVGPQNFGANQKNGRGRILVWVKRDFTDFCYNSMIFYLWLYSLLYFLCTCCIVMNFPLNLLYFILIQIPLFPWEDIISKNQKIQSISKLLLNYLFSKNYRMQNMFRIWSSVLT